MEKTRFSFGLLKVASLGLIMVYLAAVITVGAAGHDSWDTVSFLAIFIYLIFLVTLLFKFQKNKNKTTGTFLLVMLIPAVALLSFYVFMILADIFSGKSGIIEIEILIASVLLVFIASSILVIREILFRRRPN
ncbi:MAG: hypothetical protein HYZ44_10995 [Bacteroidetes bacterium]|nr:hypothetical protein [Bacteroidota bacterium]